MPELDLAGQWKILHDPLSQGLADHWWRNPPADGWCDIHVPSAWQTVLGPNANGIAWYRKPCPKEALDWAASGDHVRLRFESVATECRAWLDSVEIGRHLGDWMPFEFDLTDALRRCRGIPELFIRVDQYHAPRPAKGVVVENGHIAKGFHDVLSIQHAGIWGGVRLRRTGPVTIVPNGVAIDANPDSRRIAISIETTGPCDGEGPQVRLHDPEDRIVSPVGVNTSNGLQSFNMEFELGSDPTLWSPDSPSLYAAEIRYGAGDSLEIHKQRFGFRAADTGGPNNSQILLNGRPLQIRGILHWGHEPSHIAPAPPREQVRAEFVTLKELGFNCVCLCMFYPPDYYYEIADEMGILIWQEHPIWKSRMTGEFMPEYRRCYEAFLRRDRNHASVILVSATCEHEAYDADLGKWWWGLSAKMLPRTLRQLQTGFLEQTPPDQTDLYDDHVYDNAGRWINFLEDMQSRIAELPPKPFVMGETIISNAWPDLPALQKVREEKPWWLSHGLDECESFEKSISRRFGSETLDRFKSQARRFALDFRKSQAESFRTFPRNAGFVTNSIRDVPICRIGFMNDLDRWRFELADTRAWLNDAILLLQTPGHFRGIDSAESPAGRVGLSNFSPNRLSGEVAVRLDGRTIQRLTIDADCGEIAWKEIELGPPVSNESKQFSYSAEMRGVPANQWTLISLPRRDESLPLTRMTGVPFNESEQKVEFEERRYSSGWGLPCRTWKPQLPLTAALFPDARVVLEHEPLNPSLGVLVTHRLTPNIHDFLRRGGRCILLAHRHAGGMGSKWINLWGQLPLIIESDAANAIIRRGESELILTLLPFDLTRWTTRAIPTDDYGAEFAEHIDPVIRYVWTHDSGIPKCFDALFSARVEHGLLLVTSLDHSTPAGRWLFTRIANFAANAELVPPRRELDLKRFVMTA